MARGVRRFLVLACPLFLLAACAIGDQVIVPGELKRPPDAAKAPVAAPQVVVLDFEHTAPAPGVVGRDFDHVRPIEWKGEPGKAMADLVAGVLAEKGVGVFRVALDGPALGTGLVRVTGQVRRFEVNARRRGGVKIVNEAAVSLTVTAAGGSLSAPVSFTATSSASADDMFVTEDGLRQVLFSCANSAAEEVARRLLEAGAVAPAPSGK